MHNIYYLYIGLSGEHCCPLGYLFCMVGPCGRILPQWLRGPCNGVSKTYIVVGKVQCVCVCVCVCARSTQYADGRTLG